MDSRRYRDLLPAPNPPPAPAPAPAPPSAHPAPSGPSSLSSPASSPESPKEPLSSTPVIAKNRRQLTRVACESCRRKKAKCNGRRPICSRCATLNLECYFDADPDVSRAASLRRDNEILRARVHEVERVLDDLTSRPEAAALAVFNQLRSMRADAMRSAGGLEFSGSAGSEAVKYVGVLDDHLRVAASDYRLLGCPDARLSSLEVVAELYVHISTISRNPVIKKTTHMMLALLLAPDF